MKKWKSGDEDLQEEVLDEVEFDISWDKYHGEIQLIEEEKQLIEE
jgi:hypothetical protein